MRVRPCAASASSSVSGLTSRSGSGTPARTSRSTAAPPSRVRIRSELAVALGTVDGEPGAARNATASARRRP